MRFLGYAEWLHRNKEIHGNTLEPTAELVLTTYSLISTYV